VLGTQCGDHIGAGSAGLGGIDAGDEDVQRRAVFVVLLRGEDQRSVRQCLAIAEVEATAVGLEGVELGELHAADGGLDVGEVVLVSEGGDLVVPGSLRGVALPGIARDPVQPEHLHPGGKLVVIGGDHSAFARGEVLRGVEGEGGGGANRTDALAAVLRRQGMGGVFDDAEPVLGGHLHDRAHVARVPGDVDGEDGSGARGHRGRHGRRIDVQGARVHVDEHGCGPEVQDHLSGGHEGIGRGDHLVAGTDPESQQRQVECCSTGGAGDGVPGADIGGELLLEGDRLWPGGEPSGAEHAGDGLDLVLTDRRDVERDVAVGVDL